MGPLSATSYIANCGLIISVGGNTLMNFGAYRAGINTYQAANYHSFDHHQVTLALVPDDVLPPLAESIEEAELLSFRDERLLQMTHMAAQEALSHYRGEPVPLILAGPENYPGLVNQLPANFLSALKTQIDLPILYSASRVIGTGRTGVLEALRLAQFYLRSGQHDHVLIGGVDSCQHSAWLNFLDSTERLKSASPHRRADTFVPGEGAAFLLLTNNPAYAMITNGLRRSGSTALGHRGIQICQRQTGKRPFRRYRQRRHDLGRHAQRSRRGLPERPTAGISRIRTRLGRY